MDPNQIPPYPFLTRKMLAFEQGIEFAVRLKLISSSVDPIEVRGFTKEGPFVFTHIPAGDFSEQTFDMALPDFPIQISVASKNDTGLEKAHYAILQLLVNGNENTILAQGNIGPVFGISWPVQAGNVDMQNNGVVTKHMLTGPATGADFNDVVPDNVYWELLGIRWQFVADANAADRTIKLVIGNSFGPKITRTGAATIQASESQFLNFVPGGTTAVITADQEQEIAIPSGIILGPGSTIETVTTNIQVGDVHNGMNLFIRENFKLGN